MIWINLEDKLPTDSDINGWEPWSQEKWEKWKDESERLHRESCSVERRAVDTGSTFEQK